MIWKQLNRYLFLAVFLCLPFYLSATDYTDVGEMTQEAIIAELKLHLQELESELNERQIDLEEREKLASEKQTALNEKENELKEQENALNELTNCLQNSKKELKTEKSESFWNGFLWGASIIGSGIAIFSLAAI